MGKHQTLNLAKALREHLRETFPDYKWRSYAAGTRNMAGVRRDYDLLYTRRPEWQAQIGLWLRLYADCIVVHVGKNSRPTGRRLSGPTPPWISGWTTISGAILASLGQDLAKSLDSARDVLTHQSSTWVATRFRDFPMDLLAAIRIWIGPSRCFV